MESSQDREEKLTVVDANVSIAYNLPLPLLSQGTIEQYSDFCSFFAFSYILCENLAFNFVKLRLR